VHQEGADKAVGDNGAAPPGDGSVEADEDAGAEEGGGQL